MKSNLEFYQHDSNSDSHPKFKMLRVKFGWEGDGKFWALNNRIAVSENCCLDLSKKYIKASISSDLDFKMEEFDRFIDYLLTDCELIKEIEPGVITTERIQETFAQVQLNREKARERKQRNLEKVLQRSGEKDKSSGEPNNRSKVKESKVKESKIYKRLQIYLEQKIIQNNMIEIKDKIFEFFNYRMNEKIKCKKQPYSTEKGIDGLFVALSGCRKSGLIISECLDKAMQDEWLKPDPSYFKINNKHNFNKITRSEQNALACQQFIEGAGNER